MAIVKMSNFSLFTFDSERDNLLHELQKFEYVHFLNLDEDESLADKDLKNIYLNESIGEVNEEISKVKYSIDILSRYCAKENGIKAMIKGKENFTFGELEDKALKYDYIFMYNHIKKLSENLDYAEKEIMKLITLKEILMHWIRLNYPIRDLKKIKLSQILIGMIPKKMVNNFNRDLLDLNYSYIEVVDEDKDNIYLFILSLKEELNQLNEILRNNNYSSIKLEIEETPKEEINIIDEKLKILEDEIKEIEKEIKDLSKNISDLEISYDFLTNKRLRLVTSEDFLMTEKVNVIKGYIPTYMKEEFIKIVKKSQKNAYYLEIKDADKDGKSVPILLKNSKFAQSFESLTSMFALPRYNEIDPTPLLAPFYLAFFGMMVADAGYGILMLIATLFALKKVNLSYQQEKTIRFFYYLSYSTIVWGMFFGSYLGGAIDIAGIMNPAEQYQELLVISIVFGLIHLFFALGIKAYMSIRDKKYLEALCDVGFWYMALAGGIVVLLTMIVDLPPTLKKVAFIVMIVGMAGIVLTGGRDSKSIVGKLAGGAYSLYGISSYVGDFVSYSRLMALGLSGGFIASAINMMVGMLFDKGIMGIIGGIVVFVIGQLFNIFLSILGSYVHTIRLTYVEFFGKFYEGGGLKFNLFRVKPKYINLK